MSELGNSKHSSCKHSNSESEELLELLLAWEDGTIDASEVQRIRQMLRDSAKLREEYVRHQMIDASLRNEGSFLGPVGEGPVGNDPVGGSPVSEDRSAKAGSESTFAVSRGWQVRTLLAIAAGLVFCLVSFRWGQLKQNPMASVDVALIDGTALNVASVQPPEKTSNGIALLTRLVDASFGDEAGSLVVGEALKPGLFSIESGFAQIEFFCGASVVLEGPASIDLQSINEATMHRGRMRAQVPPAARGFSINVRDTTVVDLGTEFAVSVTDDSADVQVFDGEVDLVESNATSRQRLTAGQAQRQEMGGSWNSAVVTPAEFVDLASLESRAADQQLERFERWQSWSSETKRDDRLIVYYAMEKSNQWNRKLQSDVMTSSGELDDELDGAIVGAQQVAGRWQQKSALEFKHPGDRVRVQVPGEYTSLSMMCWARIDSLDRRYNSLFLTDNYNEGEPHWQILETGQLYFSVLPTEPGQPTQPGQKKRRDHKSLSPSFWTPAMSGQWLHLAVTFDAPDQIIRHFVNGQVVHEDHISLEGEVRQTRIGMASIGNWSMPTLPDDDFAIRNLNGRIDEFVMFDDAMSPSEIKTIYEIGNPE